MKLLQFNSGPIDIDPENIQSIDPISSTCMQVNLKDGSIYKGYHMKL
jgi:hypothetical protein